MGLSRRRGPAQSAQLADQRLRQQVTRVRGLVEALMFDLAAWLAAADRPVTPDLNPSYPFNELRHVPTGRDRLAAYVSEEQLGSWGQVIEHWLTYGSRLLPSFGHRTALLIEGLDGDAPVRATVRFPNRSIILTGDRRRYCGGDWMLKVEISPNLNRIESCLLRPAADTSQGPD